MSGGSFNYLYTLNDNKGVVNELETMKEMYKVMIEIDHKCDATLTMGWMIHYLEKGIEEFKKLEKVFQAVEWYKSNDWGLGQVKEVLEEYSRENNNVTY